mmetsp:Transcript_20662/g.33350  ORF Transcript_20662/g.33350 Transcript_20662/m.33350 type:complete len:89 (+) Transcript_20662:397-663(+)
MRNHRELHDVRELKRLKVAHAKRKGYNNCQNRRTESGVPVFKVFKMMQRCMTQAIVHGEDIPTRLRHSKAQDEKDGMQRNARPHANVA